mgnify:CR=1 FL=1
MRPAISSTTVATTWPSSRRVTARVPARCRCSRPPVNMGSPRWSMSRLPPFLDQTMRSTHTRCRYTVHTSWRSRAWPVPISLTMASPRPGSAHISFTAPDAVRASPRGRPSQSHRRCRGLLPKSSSPGVWVLSMSVKQTHTVRGS